MKFLLKLKGLRIYIIMVLLLVSVFTYAQVVGWRWWFSTGTKPDETTRGHRYFFHK